MFLFSGSVTLNNENDKMAHFLCADDHRATRRSSRKRRESDNYNYKKYKKYYKEKKSTTLMITNDVVSVISDCNIFTFLL